MKQILVLVALIGMAACHGESASRDHASSTPVRHLEATTPATAPEAAASAADVTTAEPAADPANFTAQEAAPEEGGPVQAVGAPVQAAGAQAQQATGEGSNPRPVVFLDVRRPDEWAAGRVSGAIHIPHTELTERWPELEAYRDHDIVLYCRTGRRSGIAEQILKEAGFERLHNGGGLVDLARQGVPVEY
jgi:phage shock protein E